MKDEIVEGLIWAVAVFGGVASFVYIFEAWTKFCIGIGWI